MAKEAKARIKINKLLEEAGWRFFDTEEGWANIVLENYTKTTQKQENELGDDFEQTKKGFVDYLLLDENGKPLMVLEAKREEIHPLSAKEQARRYAQAQNCRFILLSNGNQHYFWDLQVGNPTLIQTFPSPKEAVGYSAFQPNREALIKETVKKDYLALIKQPHYAKDPRFQAEKLRDAFLQEYKLRFLRDYQVRAIERIQEEVKAGKTRFLFEMATGTGKTLTAAAVINLFLKTNNARKVLFLVDRIELEEQAAKNFREYLSPDYTTFIYKEKKDDWRHAEIVVSTVQSFLFKNKYKRIFVPTDFDLVISDEAHRSIGGNSRGVFEYFVGYKLGLTATPKDYLKKLNTAELSQKDPRELERRMLLDTYTTFGCEDGKPTFQYSLLHGVREGFLINPKVIDARTEITTQLLSEKGYYVAELNEDSEEAEQSFFHRDFERKFFSEETNKVFCKTFLENALRDPITQEVGKTLIFCVSQKHATKITQILNEMADKLFPNKYSSDFALQVSSLVDEAQIHTQNFTNNKLSGRGNFNPLYNTSKTRVCVTVGMMTTGYDCPDLLNVCLMRPIFSPSDFVQIKGRGTRKHNFTENLIDKTAAKQVAQPEKQYFKLFDFFANCEYFEEKFDYDQIIKLPPRIGKGEYEGSNGTEVGGTPVFEEYEIFEIDALQTLSEIEIGTEGMKIDRMYFDRFEENIKADTTIQDMMERKDVEGMEKYIADHIFEKPDEYYNLEKLRNALKLDRRLSLREIVEKIMGYIPTFKYKEEIILEAFEAFDSRYKPEEQDFLYAKHFFRSYILDAELRTIVESKNFALLNTNPNGEAFRKLPDYFKKKIPEYIKDNVPLNQFMA